MSGLQDMPAEVLVRIFFELSKDSAKSFAALASSSKGLRLVSQKAAVFGKCRRLWIFFDPKTPSCELNPNFNWELAKLSLHSFSNYEAFLTGLQQKNMLSKLETLGMGMKQSPYSDPDLREEVADGVEEDYDDVFPTLIHCHLLFDVFRLSPLRHLAIDLQVLEHNDSTPQRLIDFLKIAPKLEVLILHLECRSVAIRWEEDGIMEMLLTFLYYDLPSTSVKNLHLSGSGWDFVDLADELFSPYEDSLANLGYRVTPECYRHYEIEDPGYSFALRGMEKEY